MALEKQENRNACFWYEWNYIREKITIRKSFVNLL